MAPRPRYSHSGTLVIEVAGLTAMLLTTERKLVNQANASTNTTEVFRLRAEARGVALARSYVEEMAKW